MVCLPKDIVQKFLQGLKSGEVNPDKLSAMDSTSRRAFLEDFVGKDAAPDVNALFESKLALHNWQQGVITWIKEVGGLKPEAQRDILSQIGKFEKLLTPEKEEAFLHDLVSKKLKTEVTLEEANRIADLSRSAKMAQNDLSGDAMNKAKQIEYGSKLLDLREYMDGIKPKNKDIISNVANVPKTVMTTLDFSAALRQGWGMLSRKQFYTSFVKMFQYAFNKGKYRELQASILGDPEYPLMKKSGLRISSLADRLSQREEAYLTTLTSKVPGIDISERAFVGFLNKLRVDTFKHLINVARVNGEDVGLHSRVITDIANVVNDFTGSGNIGKNDRYNGVVPGANAAFFSLRKVSSALNILNPARYIDPRISKTARQAALRNLIGSMAITTTVLGLAKAAGQKVETDPTSADFGKIVEGNMRLEVSGGNNTYLILLARLLSGKTKSSTTGKITQLGQGYKPETRGDLLIQSTRNKLSPIASFVADWLFGPDNIGTPFEVKKELLDRVTPMIIGDTIDIMKDDPSNLMVGMLSDLFGVGVQTYMPNNIVQKKKR